MAPRFGISFFFFFGEGGGGGFGCLGYVGCFFFGGGGGFSGLRRVCRVLALRV